MKKLYFLVVLAISFATQAQIVNIPDANFKFRLLQSSPSNFIAKNLVGNYFKIDSNNDGQIQISEALEVSYMDVSSYSGMSSLVGVESFVNLKTLDCEQVYQLTTLNVSSLINLEILDCSHNPLTSLNVTGLNNLQIIDCSNNHLSSLNLNGLTNLINVYCSSNQFSNLSITNLPNLQNLNCSSNFLTNLNLNNLNNLIGLSCGNNLLTSLNVNSLTNLQNLSFNNNQLDYIDLSLLINLQNLTCNNNQLTTLNLNNLNNLQSILCNENQITSLDLNNLNNLTQIDCSNNLLTTLNTTNLTNLYELICINNQLESLFIKNGSYEANLYFYNNPNLVYICCDDNQIQVIKNNINFNSMTCEVNSYCSFVPGGTYYTLTGNTKFDSNINGCDNLDFNYSNLKFNQTVSNNLVGVYVANQSGNYSIPVQAGNHTITPVLENPTYFNISPTSFIANFPTQTSPLIQDFCVTANGVHHDVEVTIIPTNPARPGFDANYTIIYKNKGNQIENGAITLDFNDAVLDLVSANPTTNNQQPSTLIWNYTNLQPFETRIIDLVFNVNSPMETPAVNIDDQLNYTAAITPLGTDEVQYDNTSAIKQIVVGSYDPNDKICIEGTTVGPDMIGQYVHYIIRFENTGTYPAENVVVKDLIDLSKFDVNTLIPLHSSHDFVTRIAGNKVEFIFEGINLPFDDANNDGYVAFKIKTKSNLVVGDTFSNNSNIYFDYNFPITTNTFTTTIAALKVTDFDFRTHFTLYPNPVKDVLNFQSKDNTTINSIEIYNTLGQIVLAIPNAISTVDVSSLESGNYYVKVNTDLGVSNTKFIKE